MKLLPSIGARVAEAYAYRHEPEYLRILTESYWRAILCFSALIVVCSAAFGAFQLFSVLDTGADPGVAPLSRDRETTLDRAQLQATLDGLAARQVNYSFLKTHPPKAADPSR